jgi:sulfide:quinone oxidoreductase
LSELPNILILGAGFGGLELATTLSEALGERVQITLIDRADAFVFGYSKLDVMFGRTALDAVKLPYGAITAPGVRFVKATITAIDPAARSVSTDSGSFHGEHLVIALGADYDLGATPGLGDGDNEFYSVGGAVRMAQKLSSFDRGRAVIGVCGTPFKCPPAPSECALLLHDHLSALGARGDCEIEFVIPFATPVPPSPETSAALVQAFAERDIRFVPGRRPVALDTANRVVTLDDGSKRSYDLFLGVPKHRAPDVVIASGMAEDGYIPVASATLETRYPNVYACGDVATVGVPKAGVFAEGAARAVAEQLIARLQGQQPSAAYEGKGSCYIEFGAGRVGRVDVDFLSGPKPTGAYRAPSTALVAEKREFGASRRARWFGL